MARRSVFFDYCAHLNQSIERGSCPDCNVEKAVQRVNAPAVILSDPGEHHSYTFGRRLSGINEAIELGKRTGVKITKDFQFGKRRN